ncbi:cysteine protease inhibitor cystatin, partial [Trifolium medium]|nr:cysteine protease inhibitor cystatin [Trifolium medium]
GKGTFSCITLEAKDGEKVNVYEAHIWDNPSSGWQDLSALHLVGDDDGDDAPTVDNFACFAVDQHNLKEAYIFNFYNIDILEFVKVVDMKECFVDDGMLYYIILLAKVGEKVNVYGAEILKQDCDLKELKEFNLLGEGPFDDSAKSQEQLQD